MGVDRKAALRASLERWRSASGDAPDEERRRARAKAMAAKCSEQLQTAAPLEAQALSVQQKPTKAKGAVEAAKERASQKAKAVEEKAEARLDKELAEAAGGRQAQKRVDELAAPAQDLLAK